jgi:hypothetical protein
MRILADLSGPGLSPVTNTYEYGNETSGSIQVAEFLDYVADSFPSKGPRFTHVFDYFTVLFRIWTL